MDPALLLVLLTPIVPVAVALAITWRRKGARVASAWRSAASQLGLAYDPATREIRGESKGLGVAIVAGGAGDATLVAVDGRGTLPPDLVVTPRGVGAESGLVAIGDAAFDAAVAVRGDPVGVFALLDARTRRRLASSVAINGTRVEKGRVTLRVPWVVEDPVALVDLVRRTIDVARSLGREATPERLVSVATTDPEPRVRARIAAWIGSRIDDRELFRPIIDAALDGESDEVRSAVLRALGVDAAAWLTERVDAAGTPASRVRALRLLAAAAPPGAAWPIVERFLLGGGEREILLAAIAIAGEWRNARARERLEELSGIADATVAAAAAAALGEIGDPASEGPLLAALARWETIVKRAAAGALGKVGSVGAVEALLRESEGLLSDAELKRAARRSVEAIQSRLGPVDSGRLTIAEGASDAGRLSPSGGGGGGELSLPDRERERSEGTGNPRNEPTGEPD